MRRLSMFAAIAALSLSACVNTPTPTPPPAPPIAEPANLDEAAAIRVEQSAAILANAAAIAIARGAIPADRLDQVVTLRNTAQAWVVRSRIAYDLRNAEEYDYAVDAATKALAILRAALPADAL